MLTYVANAEWPKRWPIRLPHLTGLWPDNLSPDSLHHACIEHLYDRGPVYSNVYDGPSPHGKTVGGGCGLPQLLRIL
jgi:hypothetical protein